MTPNPFTDRPLDILNECKEKYGLDRHTTVTKNVRVYWRSFRHDENDTPISQWHTGGVAEETTKALTETFGDIIEKLKQEERQELGQDTFIIDGLVCVVPGVGKFHIQHKDGRGWDQLTDEEKATVGLDKDEDEFCSELDPNEEVPTRMIACISIQGLITEVTITPKGRNIQSHSNEQWTEEGVNPDASNPIEEALLSTMGFVTLLRNSVAAGNGLGLSGVLETISGIPPEEGGRVMLADFLKLIASGIMGGIIDLPGSGDDD